MQASKDSLLLQVVDQFDITILQEIALESFFVKEIKILDPTDVNVPRRSRMHSKCECRGERARRFTPANLETTIVERKALITCYLIECECRGRINECDKLPRYQHQLNIEIIQYSRRCVCQSCT